jgi:hypothetical protein
MKKNILFLLFILPFSILLLNAQKHDYNWTMGYDNGQPISSEWGGMTVNFNTTPPTSLKVNRQLNFDSFGAACSDSVGTLLFYSNGIAIHNYLDELMENGDSINFGQFWTGSVAGGYSSCGGFALPFPGHPNQYYFFYSGFDYEPTLQDIRNSPFYYAIVDMNANGGKGKVLSKNQVVMSGDVGWPVACKHGNGRDWWITNFVNNVPSQITFLLSPDGLSAPSEQIIGPNFSLFEEEFISKPVFSPDGRTYIRHDGNVGPRIMDFDRCTGIFSNLRLLPYPEEIFSWSASFSPDSRFLYLTKPTVVWQLDITATNISASLDTIARYNVSYCPTPSADTRVWSSQEGPDGKIYTINFSNAQCMGRIEQPSLPGLASNMAYGSFDLPRWSILTTCHFPNYRLGENENSPCDTLNFQQTGSGFFKSTYLEQDKKPNHGQSNDYTILPMLSATPSAEARAEKQAQGDLQKIMYERWLLRDEPKAKARKKNKTQ